MVNGRLHEFCLFKLRINSPASFQRNRAKGGKKPETLGRPGLDSLFFSFVLFCFFCGETCPLLDFFKSTLSADLISEMASGDPGRPDSVGGGL